MARLTTKTFNVRGELTSQKVEEIDWEPNEADLDLVTVKCNNCGNQFEMPWDAWTMFGGGITCGQCGAEGGFRRVSDARTR